MRHFTAIILVLSFWAISLNCDKEATKPSGDNGYMIVHLTDAPAFFDKVNITFSEVSFHVDSQWVKIRRHPITVNLLEWTNGKTMILGEGELPAGYYTQLRLLIESAEIIIQNITYPLPIPSGELKFGPGFIIEPGSTYELVLDFDMNRSVVSMGPRRNPIGFKLKPYIRVIPMAITGSVSGTVTNPNDLPIAYAIQGSDTTSSVMVDTDSGQFILAFLPEGNYTVAIEDTLGKSHIQNEVSVAAGKNNDIGDVTLE